MMTSSRSSAVDQGAIHLLVESTSRRSDELILPTEELDGHQRRDEIDRRQELEPTDARIPRGAAVIVHETLPDGIAFPGLSISRLAEAAAQRPAHACMMAHCH